jgi:FHA domain
MASHGRRTARQFQCSDALWDTFRRMAADQEKGVDELINDALEAYAQLAGYQTGIDAEPAFAGVGDGLGGAGFSEDGPATPPPVHPPQRRGGLPPPPPPMPMPGGRSGRGAPPSPGAGAFGGMFQPGPTPPPLSASYISSSDGTPGVPAPPLYLVFDNQKYRIDKDQFIIGRGAKSSDLPIKDGNISRKHAAVVRRNGTYFIKDLGSTNGIDFKGMRIDNKRIDEGDVFHLCDYELRFTYKR